MEQTDADPSQVHRRRFECDGPVEVTVELGVGRLDVQLGPDTEVAELTVQVRPDPAAGPPWSSGITGLLSWLGEQAGAIQPSEMAIEAARRTAIDFTGRRLTVRTPQDIPLRSVPLTITVNAPTGSSIIARSAAGDVTVDGVADRLDVSTGTGQVRAQRCTGPVDVRTGSGDVRLGSVLGTLRVRTGSGLVDVVSLDAVGGLGNSGTVHTGTGDVRFGAVGCDLTARTGRGDLLVVDASAGRLELNSGSGQLRVGIHAGVWAELDISSGSGAAHSELPVTGPPAEGDVALRVKGRTGSGNALITAAPA